MGNSANNEELMFALSRTGVEIYFLSSYWKYAQNNKKKQNDFLHNR